MRFCTQGGAGGCPAGLTCPWNVWKFQSSKHIAGLWYSTPSNGNCDNPDADYCTWRLVETVKTAGEQSFSDGSISGGPNGSQWMADAGCVNGWLHKAVETRGYRCFEACGLNATNATTQAI